MGVTCDVFLMCVLVLCFSEQGICLIIADMSSESEDSPACPAQQEESWSEAKMEELLTRTELVLSQRTDRIVLVLERCTDNINYLACLRTAESLGIQQVWIVLQPRGYHKVPPPKDEKKEAKDYKRRVRMSRQSAQWLDIRSFSSTTDCIDALKQAGIQIWATDLSEGAVPLESPGSQVQFPDHVAIVMGREADGVTQEMLSAADRRIYIPLCGFNTSLNLSVATGMVLHHLLLLYPEVRGDMSQQLRKELRKDWYIKLARTDAQREAFLARLDSPPLMT